MSSTGGGIVVKANKIQGAQTQLSKEQGQHIVDCLLAAGYTMAATAIQEVVNDAD